MVEISQLTSEVSFFGLARSTLLHGLQHVHVHDQHKGASLIPSPLWQIRLLYDPTFSFPLKYAYVSLSLSLSLSLSVSVCGALLAFAFAALFFKGSNSFLSFLRWL